jgi:hypothetical protein
MDRGSLAATAVQQPSTLVVISNQRGCDFALAMHARRLASFGTLRAMTSRIGELGESALALQ